MKHKCGMCGSTSDKGGMCCGKPMKPVKAKKKKK